VTQAGEMRNARLPYRVASQSFRRCGRFFPLRFFRRKVQGDCGQTLSSENLWNDRQALFQTLPASSLLISLSRCLRDTSFRSILCTCFLDSDALIFFLPQRRPWPPAPCRPFLDSHRPFNFLCLIWLTGVTGIRDRSLLPFDPFFSL